MSTFREVGGGGFWSVDEEESGLAFLLQFVV